MTARTVSYILQLWAVLAMMGAISVGVVAAMQGRYLYVAIDALVFVANLALFIVQGRLRGLNSRHDDR